MGSNAHLAIPGEGPLQDTGGVLRGGGKLRHTPPPPPHTYLRSNAGALPTVCHQVGYGLELKGLAINGLVVLCARAGLQHVHVKDLEEYTLPVPLDADDVACAGRECVAACCCLGGAYLASYYYLLPYFMLWPLPWLALCVAAAGLGGALRDYIS